MAKNDRKKTCWPGGTPRLLSAVALTSAAITVKTATLAHFRTIPASGRWVVRRDEG